MCRGKDLDRAPKFRQLLQRFGADGEMADLDDSPDQTPLPADRLQQTACQLLGGTSYDLILTHGPKGEYTQHRRHSECCHTVVDLWRSGRIETNRLWLFAYEDGGRAYLPRVRVDADLRNILTNDVWLEKYRLITDFYGFGLESWEARTTPKEEGFYCFDSAESAATRTAVLEQRL